MKKKPFSAKISVTVFREGDAFVAYSPALDLSSVGKTLEEARKNFAEAVEILFKETVSTGTLEEVLKELGWKQGGQANRALVPPAVVAQDLQEFQIPLY